MIEESHFKAAGLSDELFEAHFGGGVLKYLQDLLAKAKALGPAGVVLAEQIVADVNSHSWLALASDVLKLMRLLESQPAPVPAPASEPAAEVPAEEEAAEEEHHSAHHAHEHHAKHGRKKKS